MGRSLIESDNYDGFSSYNGGTRDGETDSLSEDDGAAAQNGQDNAASSEQGKLVSITELNLLLASTPGFSYNITMLIGTQHSPPSTPPSLSSNFQGSPDLGQAEVEYLNPLHMALDGEIDLPETLGQGQFDFDFETVFANLSEDILGQDVDLPQPTTSCEELNLSQGEFGARHGDTSLDNISYENEPCIDWNRQNNYIHGEWTYPPNAWVQRDSSGLQRNHLENSVQSQNHNNALDQVAQEAMQLDA